MNQIPEEHKSDEDREYERAHFYFMGRYELPWITATSYDESWRLMQESKQGNCLQCLKAGPAGGSCCSNRSITYQTSYMCRYINPLFITKVVNETASKDKGDQAALTVLNENGVFRQRMPPDEWELWGILFYGTEYMARKQRRIPH